MDIIKQKFELKFKNYYSNIGKIPGVLIEENKRRKLLKELGVEIASGLDKAKNSKEDSKGVEPLVEDVP